MMNFRQLFQNIILSGLLVFLPLSGAQLIAANSTSAVNQPVANQPAAKPTVAKLPAATATDSAAVDTTQRNVPAKTPMGAVWRSLVLPGWGQLYNHSYWKAPIFIGGAGTLAYFIVDNHNKFASYRDKLDQKKFATPLDSLILRNNREYYRDNRDQCGFWLLGVYILSAVDAYVGAHLYDFSVDEKLSFNFGPSADGGVFLNCSFILK